MNQSALYVVSTPVASTSLQSDLGRALERDQFELHYQPLYRVDQGRPYIAGVEALLRWRSSGQLVPPLAFIPTLEATGQIVPVGEWVLQRACRQVRDWQLAGQGQLHCSVNVSSLQLEQVGFAASVRRVLQACGLPPASLILEITESQWVSDSAQVKACLDELVSMGVRLALDDFGTGYSALSCLLRFPLSILKVDRSFVSGQPQSGKLHAICRAIIGLGCELGFEVVAEGVEEADHLDFIVGQGCHYAQGYLLSRPLPPTELQRLFN